MSPAPLTPAEENRQRALIIAGQKAAEKAASDAAFNQKMAAYRQGIEDFIPAKATKFYQLCLGLIDRAVAEGRTEVEINTDRYGSVFYDIGLQIYNMREVAESHIPERCWALAELRLLGLGYQTRSRSQMPSHWGGREEDVLPDFIVTISW